MCGSLTPAGMEDNCNNCGTDMRGPRYHGVDPSDSLCGGCRAEGHTARHDCPICRPNAVDALWDLPEVRAAVGEGLARELED